MRAGRRDRLISLHRKVVGEPTDEFGAEDVTWPVVAHEWAERLDVGGSEMIRGGQVMAEIDARFLIGDPHIPLDATMRVQDNGHWFEIVRIAHLPKRGEGFEILVKSLDRTGAVN